MQRHLDMHPSDAAGASDAGAIDPVCGMSVDQDVARERGLHVRHADVDYFFCGKGCKLDFEEDPGKFLAVDYQPHM